MPSLVFVFQRLDDGPVSVTRGRYDALNAGQTVAKAGILGATYQVCLQRLYPGLFREMSMGATTTQTIIFAVSCDPLGRRLLTHDGAPLPTFECSECINDMPLANGDARHSYFPSIG